MREELTNLCTDFFWIMPQTPKYTIDGVPYITSKNIKNGNVDFSKCNYITIEDYNALTKTRKIQIDDFLISMIGTLGEVAIVKEKDGDFYGQNIFLLRINKEKNDLKYVYYFLTSAYVKEKLNSSKKQATQSYLKYNDIVSLSVPVYSLDKQQEIVSILDKINAIIDADKKQLELLDESVKSRFIEMFGNPETNSKSLPVNILNNICLKVTDGTHDTPKRIESGILFITGKNIREYEFEMSNVEFISKEDHKIIYSRCNPEFGDVLYTNVGANYGTALYNTLDFEFSLKNVALLKPKRDLVNGRFLWLYLNIMKSTILEKNKSGGAQTFMSLATIKNIEVFLPPIEEQNKFEDFCKQIDKSKFNIQQHLKLTQELLDKKMDEYFG